MTKFYVFSQIDQKNRREIEKMVRDEAKAMEADGEYDEYSHKPNNISCHVCEIVEKTNDPYAYISVPIYADGVDAGYLHVYGWRIKNE